MRPSLRHAFLAGLFAASPACADWSGRVGLEYLYFWNEPEDKAQHMQYGSAFIEPKFNREWDDGKQQFNFTGFARLDPRDDERQHADIRELEYLKVGESHELRVGIRKVFWGVTEAQHLVDIVNQSDIVENPDGDTKLGQPMLNVAFIHDVGTLDLFVMPYFRERTFPGKEGRPRFRFVVDEGLASYEAGSEERHLDFAARWSMSTSGLDLGLSYFYGTSRLPRLIPTPIAPGQIVLAPRYDLIHQFGLDATYVDDAWLWKLEVINREHIETWHLALSAGFEYTFSGVRDSAVDVGLLAEYLYDDRGEDASTIDLIPPIQAVAPPSAFQNDLFVGMRIGFNDVQSSQILAGLAYDLDGRGLTYSVKAERRLGETWKLNLEWRGYAGAPPDDVLHALRNEDSARVTLAWYF